jgi:hypothetical protein
VTPEETIALAREIFSDAPSQERGLKWWLFEHGTLVLTAMRSCGEAQALDEMKWLAEQLGPYEGQGSVYGDVNPMPLKRHAQTWLVTYPFTGAIVSFVNTSDFASKAANALPPDEVVQASSGAVHAREALGNLRAGLIGRMKRNLDARERKIIARSEDA